MTQARETVGQGGETSRPGRRNGLSKGPEAGEVAAPEGGGIS